MGPPFFHTVDKIVQQAWDSTNQAMTAHVIVDILAAVLTKEDPDLVLVQGDPVLHNGLTAAHLLQSQFTLSFIQLAKASLAMNEESARSAGWVVDSVAWFRVKDDRHEMGYLGRGIAFAAALPLSCGGDDSRWQLVRGKLGAAHTTPFAALPSVPPGSPRLRLDREIRLSRSAVPSTLGGVCEEST